MNVSAAVVCPMTPLLFRHLSGAADPQTGLREAAVQAVRDAVADARQVLVLCPVGGREAPADWHDPSGLSTGSGPLSRQVGEHLLSVAGCALPASYLELPVAGSPLEQPEELVGGTDEPVALLVLGDGAAARGQSAPGHLDERSFAYDDQVAALLAAGDGDGLTRLDEHLGAELMATGRHSWPVLGSLVPRADAELRFRDDPYGLTYFVALWRNPRVRTST